MPGPKKAKTMPKILKAAKKSNSRTPPPKPVRTSDKDRRSAPMAQETAAEKKERLAAEKQMRARQTRR
jgi:hypothetical protein